MENITAKLEKIKQDLLSSSKEKLLCISTTANKNNPEIFIGSARETDTTIAGNIILQSAEMLGEIVETFDGVADCFLVDCEVKNEIADLEMKVRGLVQKSKIFVYKPNDFTVESLDMFIALLFPVLQGKKVGIIGAGNIGSKIALKLCERGADVFLYGRDASKTETIINGLVLIRRGSGSLTLAKSEGDLAGAELLLGCTPGVPAVSESVVRVMKESGKVIDVGNGTLTPDAVLVAGETGREVLVLSSFAGYKGMIENWIAQRSFFEKKRERSLGKYKIIISGVLGKRGDVIVDDVDLPEKVIGICDGKGDIALPEDAQALLKDFIDQANDKDLALKIGVIYDNI